MNNRGNFCSFHDITTIATKSLLHEMSFDVGMLLVETRVRLPPCNFAVSFNMYTFQQILTHVHEKLHYIGKACLAARSQMRGDLTVSKHERAAIRRDNKLLRREQGFASSDLLLLDFENRLGYIQDLRAGILDLQTKYKTLAVEAGLGDTAAALLSGTGGGSPGFGSGYSTTSFPGGVASSFLPSPHKSHQQLPFSPIKATGAAPGNDSLSPMKSVSRFPPLPPAPSPLKQPSRLALP